jgi:hypothetical protein
MKHKRRLDSRIGNLSVAIPGTYDVWDVQGNDEWWCGISVFERSGLLRLINPRNGVEVAVKSLHGWMFLLVEAEGGVDAE